MEGWHVWVVAAIVLLVAEILAPGFLLASFAIACFGSGLVSFLGLGAKAQILTFSIVSLIFFFAVRPFVVKNFYSRSTKSRTNTDALVGKIALVTEKIEPGQNSGRVKVEGEDWSGISSGENPIEAGSKVTVISVDGARLLVKPAAAERKE
jgi:membrane protein implicated in regulation of membrane protease activity